MIEFLAMLATVGFLAQIVGIAVPYVLAALGGTLTERSGVIDLALEAKLLCGALAATIATLETGSVAAGIVAGAAAGCAVGAMQAYWTIRLGAEQVVTGIALNLAAFGLSRYLLGVIYGQSSNSPTFTTHATTVWRSPTVWLAVVVAAIVVVGLARTRPGLRIRAVGEHPEAVAAAGASVVRTRWLALVVGGAIAGVGGAHLSQSWGGFVAEMSGGRGYVALAAVIMSGWRPGRAALICLGFGAAEALQVRMQTHGVGLPAELVRLLPYLLALVLLAAVKPRTAAPSALGKPWTGAG